MQLIYIYIYADTSYDGRNGRSSKKGKFYIMLRGYKPNWYTCIHIKQTNFKFAGEATRRHKQTAQD